MAIDESTETLISIKKAAGLSKRSHSTIHRWRWKGLMSKRNRYTFFLEWFQLGCVQTSKEALKRFHRRVNSTREELTEEDLENAVR